MFCAIKDSKKGWGSSAFAVVAADAGLQASSFRDILGGESCGLPTLNHRGCGQKLRLRNEPIVILADMHGNELFGAIGNKFARGFGGLAIERCPL